MSPFIKRYLFGVGVVAAAGALLHIVIAFGGPEWYAFFGAPRGMVAMARSGNLRAPVSYFVIAAILAVFAAYAFSAAGAILRLPFTAVGLTAMAGVLLLRSVLFVPLILWRPGLLSRVCDCREVNPFIISTSILCLAMGVGYAVGAWAVFKTSAPRTA